MRLTLYQIDAFASRLFRGNPAAVVPLDSWLQDELLQAIAGENNLAETAFVIPDAGVCPLRWFTPTVEVDLCGHATLAAAHVLLRHYFPSRREITFSTRSGNLVVKREGNAFDSEAQVRDFRPDFRRIAGLDAFALIISAPGGDVDFVSRFFAPKAGVPEDPVTGSSHCTLTPYWARRLAKSRLSARQLSARGGELYCELRGERVVIGGETVEYLRGEINVGAIQPNGVRGPDGKSR